MKQKQKNPITVYLPILLDWRILVIIILVIAGVVWVSSTEPGVSQDQQTQKYLDSSSEELTFIFTPTPIPPELLANREQTIGIVLGGIVLVLIIVGGTASVMRGSRRT